MAGVGQAAPADNDIASGDQKLSSPAALADETPPLHPRTGDALKKASLSFEEVLERIEVPSYLPRQPNAEVETGESDASGQDGEDRQARVPPSAAARAYVRGRAAYLEGDRSRAVTQLEQARRLDPDSAHVLRMLGKAYLARGDEIRGARRIKEAVEIEPNDASSLFLLGRFAYQKGDWEETIATLARSARVDQAETDPAIPYLRPYYLGQALFQAGYDAAAIQQLRKYLELPAQLGRTTRLLREVAFLNRRRPETRTQVGDAYIRLGRFDQALAAYQRAAEPGEAQEAEPDGPRLARRVYVLLALERPRDAQRMLIDALRDADASGDPQLVSYLADRSDRESFHERLREAYEREDRSPALALAVAELLQPDAAAAFLADHLASRPRDFAVYHRLVERAGGDDPAALVRTVLKLIRSNPGSARRYVRDLFIRRDVDADRLIAALDGLPPAQRESAAGRYLRGALHESAGRAEEALASYQKARDAGESFAPAVLAMAELHARLGNFEKALELLKNSAGAEGAEVRFTRAQVLAGLDRTDEAAEVLDGLIAEQPRNPRYRLLRAELQMKEEDYTAAERTLWSIIETDPDNEDAYAALFQLYNTSQGGTSRYLRLMKRVQREIPESRLARLMMAGWHSANREFDLAEKNLRSVLAENPGDNEAIKQLVDLFEEDDRLQEAENFLIEQLQKRPDDPQPLKLLVDLLKEDNRLQEAEDLLVERLEKRPDDPQALQLLGEVTRELGHEEVLYARQEVYLKRRDDSLQKWVALAELYRQWNKPERVITALEKAVEADSEAATDLRIYLAQLYQRRGETQKALRQIERAIEQKPDRTADFQYARASILQQADQAERAEEALLAALEADPNHTPSNNDLGYLWADAGKNLERALEMTRKAVQAEPDNGAYLDSLGWAHYKLGDFQEAVNRLREATSTQVGRDPVILDHYGDALWRLGSEEQALRTWRQARGLAEQMDAERRPALIEIRKKLDAKIEAAENNQPPPLAPVPDADSDAQAE